VTVASNFGEVIQEYQSDTWLLILRLLEMGQNVAKIYYNTTKQNPTRSNETSSSSD